jgi:hypothetical protein
VEESKETGEKSEEEKNPHSVVTSPLGAERLEKKTNAAETKG